MADVTGSSKGGAGAGAGVPAQPDPAALAEIDKFVAQLAKDPKSRAFAPLADAYRKVGLLDEAIDVCVEGLKHHTNWTGGRVALARAYFEKGTKDKARQELEKVVKVAPDNPLAQRLLGILYQETGETAKAVTAFKTVLIFSPDDAEARDRLAALDPSAVEPPRAAVRPPSARPAAASVAPPAPAARPASPSSPAPKPAPTPPAAPARAPAPSPSEEMLDLSGPAEEPMALEGDPSAAVEIGVDLGAAGLGGAREIDFGGDAAVTAEAPAAAAAAELMAELTGEPEADPLSTEGLDLDADPVTLDEPVAMEGPAVTARPSSKASAVEGPPLLPLGGERPPEKPKAEITTNTIAELYIRQGFFQKALDIYRSMLQADPGNQDLALRIRQVEQEFAAKRKGEVPAAAPKAQAPAPRPSPQPPAKPAAAPAGATASPSGAPKPQAAPPPAARPQAPAGAKPQAAPAAAAKPPAPPAPKPLAPAAPRVPGAAAAAPKPEPPVSAPRPPAAKPATPPARLPAPVPPAAKPAAPAAAPQPGPPRGEASGQAGSRAGRNIQTLETWLQNIKRR